MPTMELVLLIAALVTLPLFGWMLLRPGRMLAGERSHVQRLITLPGDTAAEGEMDAEVEPVWLERRLHSAGLEVAPALWLLGVLLLALLAALLVSTFFPEPWWAAPLVGLAAAWATFAVLAEVGQARSRRFETKLIDAVDLMVAALSAGENPIDAIASAAEGAQEPVRTELLEVSKRLEGSLPIERAVGRMIARYDSEGVRLFTQILIAKWDIGGPLAPALQMVNRTIRVALRLRNQLRAQLGGAKTSAMLVAFIPYLLIPFFLAMRPGTLQLAWNHPWGPNLLIGAILLQILGFFLLRRILRIHL